MREALEADYVIVGAGSAGCVLANRLSARPDARVLLLEAGGDDRPTHNPRQFWSNLLIQVPWGYAQTLRDPKVNWLYRTEADENGRTHVWPRGKVLGGSSSINAMVYLRGQHADYEWWRQLGCEGWGWDDVAPYFSRIENWRQGDGPLDIAAPDAAHPVSDAVIAACEQAGLARTDFHEDQREGVAYFPLTVRDGVRRSAAAAFLHPAMRRANLSVETHALAERIRFQGKRAVGVEYVQGGRRRVAYARGEVILSAGSINSPHLLHLSGVGPHDLIASLGLDTVADLSGVGANLQDHYAVEMQYRLNRGVVSVNEMSRGPRLLREALKYALWRRGLFALSIAHVGAFVRSRPELEGPDLQFHIWPSTVDMDVFLRERRIVLEQAPGLSLAACQLRPESRGRMETTSPDPRIAPAIRPNYLSDPIDREAIVAAVRWARKIVSQPALAAVVDWEMSPGAGMTHDEDLLAYARKTGTTIYHPVGTCAMGDGRRAVVDHRLRVRGVERLRVVDASVMPRIVSGNPNGAVMMIAEKAAEMIRADARQV